MAALNAEFDARLAAEVPPSALGWYLNTSAEENDAAPGAGRRLWPGADAVICPPKVGAVLRELFTDSWWGLLPTDKELPASELGKFRLDHDNAHWLAPFDPSHVPDDNVDFPSHLAIDGVHEYPQSNGSWSEEGVLRGGFHAGPPLFHVSVLYELAPVGPEDGGFVRRAALLFGGCLNAPGDSSHRR